MDESDNLFDDSMAAAIVLFAILFAALLFG